MTWQEEYKNRLTSAEDALKAIRSGDRVVIPIGCNPQALGDTLAGRMDELEGVELAHTATGWPYIWLQPDLAGPFNVIHEHWASPLASEAFKEPSAPITRAWQLRLRTLQRCIELRIGTKKQRHWSCARPASERSYDEAAAEEAAQEGRDADELTVVDRNGAMCPVPWCRAGCR